LALIKRFLDEKPSLIAITNRQGLNLLHLACSASCSKLEVPEAVATLVELLIKRGTKPASAP
jgi:hypothetical protein